MTLEELLKLISDEHKEAVEAFFTAQAEKITNLSAEITDLEKKVNSSDMQQKLDDAIAKRDAAKAQLNIVRESLGLPAEKEITKELVSEHLNDSSKGDAEKDRIIESQKTDISGLESTLDDMKTKVAKIEGERDAIAQETNFIKVFSEEMPDFEPASAHARTHIESLMRENAVLEDGKIVYKGSDDAYIRVEGEKMTMKEKLAQLQSNADLEYLFKSKASGGSGSGNGGSGGSVSKFDQRRRKANV